MSKTVMQTAVVQSRFEHADVDSSLREEILGRFTNVSQLVGWVCRTIGWKKRGEREINRELLTVQT